MSRADFVVGSYEFTEPAKDNFKISARETADSANIDNLDIDTSDVATLGIDLSVVDAVLASKLEANNMKNSSEYVATSSENQQHVSVHVRDAVQAAVAHDTVQKRRAQEEDYDDELQGKDMRCVA